MKQSEAISDPGGRAPSIPVSTDLPIDPQSLPAVLPEAPPARPGWKHGFRALRHRNFRLFAAGQTVSLVGTFMQAVAQSWLVYRMTHSEWLMGAAWFCTQVPVFLLGCLGGLAADRYSRRRIVLATQAVAMLQAFALAALTLSGAVQVWHILALAILLGVVNAFDMPGRQSLLIQMTGKEDLLNAIALNSTIFNAARVVGPAIAGFVVAAVGEGICFLINGVSFLAVIASLAAMRLPRFVSQVSESPWKHLVDGLRYAYRQPAIRALLEMVASATICGMPALVLMPVFADGIFHRGSQGLGFLMGAMGIGAVVGTLVLARRSQATGLARVVFLSAVTFAAGLLVLAVSPSFYLALAVASVLGFSIMRHNASVNTLIQCLIPDNYRGRIMALYAMMVVGVGPFGSLAAGALAGRIGARGTVLCGGVLCLVAAVRFRLRVRNLPELK